MGQVVDLHSRPIPIEDDELIENLARFADNTLSMSAVKARHHLSEAEWTALGENELVVERVEARKLQRIRGGQTKRERAQIEIVDAAPLLGKIMRDPASNARHVIDSVKTLDSLATGGSSEGTAGGRVFEITINIGDQSLHFSKPIEINADNTDPNNDGDDDDPYGWGLIAIATKNKSGDGGGGQGHL